MEPFDRYTAGLQNLLHRIGRRHPHYDALLVYQQRLIENIDAARLYGDDATRRAERAQILQQINTLTLDALGIAFNELVDGAPTPAERIKNPSALPPAALPPPPPQVPSPVPRTSSVGSLPSPGNPFTPGNVVPPERFVGRERELAEIWSSLENMLSVALIGEARIGKSSILRYLEVHLARRLGAYGRYLPIYVSMDAQRSQATFCKEVLARLLPHIPAGTGQEQTLRRLEIRLNDDQPVTLEDMARALEWAAAAGLRVVLLLDEFKKMLDRPAEFDEIFQGTLRSLYSNRQVALILTLRQPLDTINGLNAYFLNGVSQRHLGLLLADEAKQLLRQPHDRPFTAAELRIGLAAGQRHPYRLQAAGFWLYHSKGTLPGPLHDEHGHLLDQATSLLNRKVQADFDNAMQASRDPKRRRSLWSRLEALGRTGIQIGESADSAQARIMGGFIIITVVTIFGLLLALATGLISPDLFGELLRRITGGT